jgi:hypothetical protein
MSSKRKGGKENDLNWKNSTAKALLRQYLEDGTVPTSYEAKRGLQQEQGVQEFPL